MKFRRLKVLQSESGAGKAKDIVKKCEAKKIQNRGVKRVLGKL